MSMMKRNGFLLLLSFCALFAFSLPSFAQSYYELSYKNQAGKQCYGFMIYEDDENITMRVVEADAKNNVTASEDIKYEGEQGTEDGQQYTALAPKKSHANAPYIVFFWGKQKGEELLPMICFDLNKEDDFKDPDSFAEVGLADITTEYLQQFYDTQEKTYKSIMAAKKVVQKQRSITKKCEEDGDDDDDDLYNSIMSLLDETNDILDDDSSSDSDDSNQGAFDQDDSDDSDQGSSDDDDADSGSDSGSNTPNTPGNTPNTPGNSPNTPGNTPNPSNAKVTIHFVSVINNVVQDIGASCKKDYDNIMTEMKSIAKNLGIQLKNYDVMGDKYSRDAVKQTLQDLKPGATDVVFFLYSGHGFRFDDQKSPFPAIALNASEYDDIRKNFLFMNEIYKEICAKNARLNIVLSDCCNTPIGINTPAARKDGTLYSRANKNYSLSRLGQLFLQARGNMLSTAASPGETSICDMTGGYYTVAFIRALRKEINATNQQAVSWNSIVNNTISSARERSQAVGNVQHGLKESTIK